MYSVTADYISEGSGSTNKLQLAVSPQIDRGYSGAVKGGWASNFQDRFHRKICGFFLMHIHSCWRLKVQRCRWVWKVENTEDRKLVALTLSHTYVPPIVILQIQSTVQCIYSTAPCTFECEDSGQYCCIFLANISIGTMILTLVSSLPYFAWN